jgi:hypothetical protein
MIRWVHDGSADHTCVYSQRIFNLVSLPDGPEQKVLCARSPINHKTLHSDSVARSHTVTLTLQYIWRCDGVCCLFEVMSAVAYIQARDACLIKCTDSLGSSAIQREQFVLGRDDLWVLISAAQRSSSHWCDIIPVVFQHHHLYLIQILSMITHC